MDFRLFLSWKFLLLVYHFLMGRSITVTRYRISLGVEYKKD
jgi:hypothetical protein